MSKLGDGKRPPRKPRQDRYRYSRAARAKRIVAPGKAQRRAKEDA